MLACVSAFVSVQTTLLYIVLLDYIVSLSAVVFVQSSQHDYSCPGHKTNQYVESKFLRVLEG